MINIVSANCLSKEKEIRMRMRKRIVGLLVAVLTLSVASCANGYKLGDLSTGYCASTDPEFREVTKKTLAGIGIEIGVDFCTTRNLIDAMIKITKPIDYGGAEGWQIGLNKQGVYNESNVSTDNFAKVQNQNFERMLLTSYNMT